jgi:hypothetical protein
VARNYVSTFHYEIFHVADTASNELVVLNVGHAARRWPWQEL